MTAAITLALSKGRIFDETLPLLAAAGITVTEDPETVPPGHVLFEAGIDRLQDAKFPVSGLSGNLWRIGTFGLR